MANNKMFLVNTRTGSRFCLGKYYPSTGWYIQRPKPECLQDELNEFFDQAEFDHLTDAQRFENDTSIGFDTPHKSGGGMYGDEWVLEYDVTSPR